MYTVKWSTSFLLPQQFHISQVLVSCPRPTSRNSKAVPMILRPVDLPGSLWVYQYNNKTNVKKLQISTRKVDQPVKYFPHWRPKEIQESCTDAERGVIYKRSWDGEAETAESLAGQTSLFYLEIFTTMRDYKISIPLDLKVHNCIYSLVNKKNALFSFLLTVRIVDKAVPFTRNGFHSLFAISYPTQSFISWQNMI